MNDIEISVVIPVYGCKAALNELYERLTKTLNQLVKNYEIIMVDDCCPQNSWELIEKICKEDSRVQAIKLSRNFGQMCAILAGLDASAGDWVVVMDCDLQDSPEDIINLYNKAMEGYDIVFSTRRNRHDNKIKIIVSNAFYKIYSWLSNDCFDPAMSNFSICKRKVIDSYCSMRESHRAFTMYLKWLGFNSTSIDVEHSFRKEGKSSYTMKKRINLAIDILTSQSDKLLKVIVSLGMVMSLISFITIVVLVISYFCNSNIATGWTSLIATMFLLGGCVLMAIGIVGIYVGNIFMESKHRPLYVVNKVLNHKEEK